jgi:hypothetical protein
MKTEQYFSLIKEHFLKLLELNELDVIEDNPEDTGPAENPEFTPEPPSSPWEPARTVDLSEPETQTGREVSADEYSKLTGIVSGLAAKLSPLSKQKADTEITRILNTGRSKMTYGTHITADKDKKNMFEYVTTALGTLYNEVSASQKENIRNFMWVAYNPVGDLHGGTSKFANVVMVKSIPYDITGSKTMHGEDYKNMVIAGVYDAIDYALKNYIPNKGTFGYLVFDKSVSNTIDNLRSYKRKVHGKTSSGDEPLTGGDEESTETVFDTMTSPEEGFTDEQKKGMKELHKQMGIFVKEKLSHPRLAKLLEYYTLFADKGYSNSEIADLTGDSELNLRQKKFKIEKLITPFVQDGSLQEFLRKRTGITVGKFPNNKFSLSARNAEDSNEPQYVFQLGVKRNPVTGEIEPNPNEPESGEWVEVKKSGKAKKYMPVDTLGDVAFGTPEEQGEEEGGEEEPLAEIKRIIREALEKF